LRKFTLLVAGVALVAVTLTACVGGPPPPPPPPPTDPRDVLVVGDSVAFSFGCVLGDAIPSQPFGCPGRPGYTAKNESSGACTITPGTLKLYNGGTAGAPNCGENPDDQGRTWDQASSLFVPKVVVINTAGWEIVDRWIESLTPQPDAQWGGPTGAGTVYERAAIYYSSRLFNAINTFRSRGAKVLISVGPYMDPPEPVPPPSQVPPDLACSWWEPYDAAPPVANGECTGGGPGGLWRSPPGSGGVSYRPSKTKVDQLNAIITQVKNQYFGSDPNVVLFNFAKHFNQPNGPGAADDTYTSYVCPPPNDFTVTPDPVTHNCAITNPNPDTVPAILARAPDNGHLSVAGTFDILQPYLEGCVRHLLGLPPPGSMADCT
jgi:hypothetical protein